MSKPPTGDDELIQDRPNSIDRLIAEGRARPARGNLADLGLPPPAPPGEPLSEILRKLRDEEPF